MWHGEHFSSAVTLIDVICKGRAFSRGWETPNDPFPLPAAQSLTQFYRKFVCSFSGGFLFISDRRLKERRRRDAFGRGLHRWGGHECGSVNRRRQLVCYRGGTTGGLRSWHWVAGGRDRRESPSLSLALGGCPRLQPAPVPGWRASVGKQALVIVVSHLASAQCVLLLSSATESVCGRETVSQGRGRGTQRPLKCRTSLHSSLHAHCLHVKPPPPSKSRTTADKEQPSSG